VLLAPRALQHLDDRRRDVGAAEVGVVLDVDDVDLKLLELVGVTGRRPVVLFIR
jgi:hypothetical protein